MVEPLDIVIREVPHGQQDYPTAGNWTADPVTGAWTITVSNMGDWRYSLLVAVHELVEMALCTQRGIPEAAVTQFDLDFEAARPDGNTDEPGHDPKAPYHYEHLIAEGLERQLAIHLDVDWDAYDAAVTAL